MKTAGTSVRAVPVQVMGLLVVGMVMVARLVLGVVPVRLAQSPAVRIQAGRPGGRSAAGISGRSFFWKVVV
jgi:hypothetical protein